VEPVWRALAERAEVLGWTLPDVATVNDPDLHILAGARRIEPLKSRDGHYVFTIPSGGAQLRLMSRSVRPRDVSPWVDDPRRLGVLVRRLTVRSGNEVREVAMDAPLLERGWNEAEWHALGPSRWTAGDALLPVLGPAVLEVVLGGTMHYPIEKVFGSENAMTVPSRVRAA
jgi:hypothetical protein